VSGQSQLKSKSAVYYMTFFGILEDEHMDIKRSAQDTLDISPVLDCRKNTSRDKSQF
jgi:hypothetical protein